MTVWVHYGNYECVHSSWVGGLLKSIVNYDNQRLTQDRYGPNHQVNAVFNIVFSDVVL